MVAAVANTIQSKVNKPESAHQRIASLAKSFFQSGQSSTLLIRPLVAKVDLAPVVDDLTLFVYFVPALAPEFSVKPGDLGPHFEIVIVTQLTPAPSPIPIERYCEPDRCAW